VTSSDFKGEVRARLQENDIMVTPEKLEYEGEKIMERYTQFGFGA